MTKATSNTADQNDAFDPRQAMLEAIANADKAGIDGHTLDRMRLATEFFTNPAFRAEMTERVRSIVMA